ncbi:Nn.00g049300.m01.CDS01 [Neocucurbitaria sp. VM-36]
MDSLTPSDLFSPSKARQQRAQAQDWAHIDSWLSFKYSGRTVPTFERNEETLKVLRELLMANERADEERIVLERVEREALKELDEVERNDDDERILSQLRSSLTQEGEEALDAIVSTAVTLKTPTADPETLAHALIQHTTTSQNLTNQLTHIETLQTYLTKQISFLRTQLNALQTNPAFSTPPQLQRQTTEQTRQTKHLRTKIREYEDKISSLQSLQSRSMTPGLRNIGSAEAIGEMLEQQQVLDELRERVKELEAQVAEFAGLPADREMARKEVGKLEVRLDEVRRRRDELFEGLVG